MWHIIASLGLFGTVSGAHPSLRGIERSYKAEALGFCTKVRGRLKEAKRASESTAEATDVELFPCRGQPKRELSWTELLGAVGRTAERDALTEYDDWAWPLRLLAYSGAALGVGLVIYGASQNDTGTAVGGLASLGGAGALALVDLWLRTRHQPRVDTLRPAIDRYNARLREQLLQPIYDEAAEHGDPQAKTLPASSLAPGGSFLPP